MSGRYFCFVPFNEVESRKVGSSEKTLKAIAGIWKTDAHDMMIEERKRPIIFQYGTSRGFLSQKNFKPTEDVIYIIGHCRKGGNSLATSRMSMGFDRGELDAKALTARLREYVSTDTVNFKLLACYGGQFYDPAEQKYEKSFAERLYRAMLPTYRNARVTGYAWPVKGGLDPFGHKRVVWEDGSEHRPSNDAVSFGG
jgi:hypothetical protein